jgi:hypothetical protein
MFLSEELFAYPGRLKNAAFLDNTKWNIREERPQKSSWYVSLFSYLVTLDRPGPKQTLTLWSTPP